MDQPVIPSRFFLYLLLCIFILSCNNESALKERKIVKDPADMDTQTQESLEAALKYAKDHSDKINDTAKLKYLSIVTKFYDDNDFAPVWSHKEKWDPLADTVIRFIKDAEQYGLFPKDYHQQAIQHLKKSLDADSLKRMDASLWATADLLFTDAFINVIKDIKAGRLKPDSTFTAKFNAAPNKDFYAKQLTDLVKQKQFTTLISSLEPSLKGYHDLKHSLSFFLDSMDRKSYTYLTYPFKEKDEKDSLLFLKNLQKRLKEANCWKEDKALPDSTELSNSLKAYQKKKGVKTDGKVSESLVKMMNNTDLEKFKRIAITLDRYKQMPEKMPEKYIWVNLPAYYLNLIDDDTVALYSKIICGKPDTRTPLLYSVISNMVTYPTWTVPSSIIKKSYLPKLKNNPHYLSRLGLKLVTEKGEPVDAGKVNWSKYSKGIPFKVMQGSGDDNALGVLKFNFANPYAVYLHDTNQRYLFKNSARDLSHGCVRVQQWDSLAYYIARNDSMNLKEGAKMYYNTDSIKNWISAKKNKVISVKSGIPLFIAYFSCEGKGNKIRFYDDIYGEDKLVREKYFSDK